MLPAMESASYPSRPTEDCPDARTRQGCGRSRARTWLAISLSLCAVDLGCARLNPFRTPEHPEFGTEPAATADRPRTREPAVSAPPRRSPATFARTTAPPPYARELPERAPSPPL